MALADVLVDLQCRHQNHTQYRTHGSQLASSWGPARGETASEAFDGQLERDAADHLEGDPKRPGEEGSEEAVTPYGQRTANGSHDTNAARRSPALPHHRISAGNPRTAGRLLAKLLSQMFLEIW